MGRAKLTPKHNHTPWPEYQKSLTTSGTKFELVLEIMDGLIANWSCPACDAEKAAPTAIKESVER